MTAQVAVITPTWQRHEFLLTRCIPSVQAQDYAGEIEHVIVSDGPDCKLGAQLSMPWLDGLRGVWYRELPEHDIQPHYGHLCRAEALTWTSARYIAYCDDDDALRPGHCRLLAAALDEHPDAGFAVSRMVSHGPHGDSVIGIGPLACGNVGTPMIMHRREMLDQVPGWDHAGQFEDWDFVLAMINAGIGHVRVDEETVDVWPSLWR